MPELHNQKVKVLIKNLTILFFTLTLCIVAGEAGLRLVVDEVNFLNPQMMAHSVLRHAIVPGSNGHDEWGFRNAEVPVEAQIVAIGDSMTYGTAVPASNSWPARLGQLAQTTVYNMGVGGYGLPDYRYLLNDKGKLLNPSLTFIGFYFGNDLPRSYQFSKKSDAKSVAIDVQGSNYTLEALRFWLSQNSLIYQMTKAAGGEVIDFLRFYDSQWISPGEGYPVIAETWRTIFDPWYTFFNLDQSSDINREGLYESLRLFDEIQDDCQIIQTRCVIVLIPTKFTVYWPIARNILKGDGLKWVRAVVEEEAKVRRVISEHLKVRAFEFVDPVESLQAAASKGPLYPGGRNTHLNARGNEILAKIIANQVWGTTPPTF